MKRVFSFCVILLGLAIKPALANDTVYYYHTDAQGTAVVVTDASHNVVERTWYGPYGEVLNRPLRDGPGYTGHEEDAATGLDNMQQRYYDPANGRFPSPDPMEVDTATGGNFNRYAYANDNPYRYTDPTGMCTGTHICNGDGTAVSTGEFTTQAKFARSLDARDVDRVFSHSSVSRLGGEATPSPFPKETRKALHKFLGSAVGGKIGAYAVATHQKIGFELILPSSGYRLSLAADTLVRT